MKKLSAVLRYATLATIIAAPAVAAPAPNDNADWSGSVGIAYGLAPIYEGSSHYASVPLPFVTVNWRDTIIFDQNGLNWHAYKAGPLTAGIGATYDNGRDQDDGSLPFNGSGDGRLLGLGDVDEAFGGRIFARYDFRPIVVDGSVAQFFGDDNDGLLAKAAVSLPHKFSEKLSVTPSVSTTWASEDYMSAYFGITPAQSAASVQGFAPYNASAGFKDVTAGVSAIYTLDQNWYVNADLRVKQLLGDAADSPISAEDTSGSLITGVGYRF